jgi:predicted DNA-binding transcriptional regulator YafY
MKGRERLQAISEHLVLSPQRRETRPSAALLVGISEAVQERRRIAIDYTTYNDAVSQRQIEPYGIAGWNGHWYVVGYCYLRQEMRLFRIDRMQNIRFLKDTFERAQDFDCQAYIAKRLGDVPPTWSIEVEFQTTLSAVQQKIPATHGKLSVTPTGILFQTHHCHLESFARYLVGLELPFTIQRPPELRAALIQLAEKLVQIATSGVSNAIEA